MLDIFKKRLNNLFTDSDMTMEEFGAEIGCKRSTMSSYLEGKNDMNTERLRDICITHGASADYLLGISDDEMMPLTGLTDQQKKDLNDARRHYLKANRIVHK